MGTKINKHTKINKIKKKIFYIKKEHNKTNKTHKQQTRNKQLKQRTYKKKIREHNPINNKTKK